LKAGQSALIQVDAMPGRQLSGRLQQISTLASVDFSAPWPFPRDFEVEVHLANSGRAKLRPGMSATALITVESVPDAVLVPAEAIFQKNGRTIAYVEREDKFEERTVEIGERGQRLLLVAHGLKPGERVALKDPTVGG
jgi:multidrug efflux pump subunit AcrA (membrane-fusion protein)